MALGLHTWVEFYDRVMGMMVGSANSPNTHSVPFSGSNFSVLLHRADIEIVNPGHYPALPVAPADGADTYQSGLTFLTYFSPAT